MTIKLYCRCDDPSDTKKEIPLYIDISAGRSYRERMVSDIFILPYLWNFEKNCLKKRLTVYPQNKLLAKQKEIDEFMSFMTDSIGQILQNRKLVKGDLKKIIDDYRKSKKTLFRKGINTAPENILLYNIVEPFLKKRNLSEVRAIQYEALKRLLIRYEAYTKTINPNFSLSLQSINEKRLESIRDYIENEYDILKKNPSLIIHENKKYNPGRRSENTVTNIEKKIRALINYCIEEELMQDNPYKKLKLRKEIYGDIVFLTPQEVDKLWNFDFSYNSHFEKMRDIFIFSTQCGMRIGDLCKLTTDNISDDCIHYIPQKTRDLSVDTLVIPLTEKARQIIEKYASSDRNRYNSEKILPFVNQAKYNQSLKTISQLAGLDRMVTIYDPRLKKEIHKPLYQCITSHVGRKTFINTLYNKGVSSDIISSMSGHAPGSRAFARYRKVSLDLKKEMLEKLN